MFVVDITYQGGERREGGRGDRREGERIEGEKESVWRGGKKGE